MRRDWFDQVKQEFDEHDNALLNVKRSEYADDEDVLVNFKEVARMVNLTPEKYCIVLLCKHFHAILRAVDSGTYKWIWADELGEGLKQRISDLRNFAVLLAALIDERVGCDDLSAAITITIPEGSERDESR